MDLVDMAIAYIQELFAGNTDGHGFDHSMRVYRNAILIMGDEPDADRFVVQMAALLHDADDHKLFSTENNANARSFLADHGVEESVAAQICDVINSVSFSKNRDRRPASLEGQIVQDADRLDAIGAIGIGRTFAFGGKHGRSLDSSIEHFHEKLLLLKDLMNTRKAREIAEHRHAFMEVFLAEWTSELKTDRDPLALATRLISEAVRSGQRTLVTLDGPCASGKTTFASQLAKACGAAVLHTDDFVVPHAQKTPERLAVPGGNCDWERLTREVLAPWKKDGHAEFRRYDCRRNCLLAPETLDAELVILEGSYCNLPAIRVYADVCLFLDTPEDVRAERLRLRESPESLQRFYTKWIPLENAYYEAYRLPDPKCFILSEQAIAPRCQK